MGILVDVYAYAYVCVYVYVCSFFAGSGACTLQVL